MKGNKDQDLGLFCSHSSGHTITVLFLSLTHLILRIRFGKFGGKKSSFRLVPEIASTVVDNTQVKVVEHPPSNPEVQPSYLMHCRRLQAIPRQ